MASTTDMKSNRVSGGIDGTVLNSVYFAGAFLSDFHQDFAFTLSRFGRIFESSPEISKTFSRFLRPVRLGTTTFVTFSDMLLWRKPFEVINSIVGFIAIFVMNVLCLRWVFKPADGNYSMQQVGMANTNISIWPFLPGIGRQLSKNFPAARYSVERVKEAVFNTLEDHAYHAALNNSNYGKSI